MKRLILIFLSIFFIGCSSTSNIQKDTLITSYKDGIHVDVYQKIDNTAEIRIYIYEGTYLGIDSNREYFILFDSPSLFNNYEKAVEIFFTLIKSKHKILSYMEYWYWYPKKYSNSPDFYYWRKY